LALKLGVTPDPCVASFRRCWNQSSPSSSKSLKPASIAPLLRAGLLQVLCAPPVMALSVSPSGPLAPLLPPPHPELLADLLNGVPRPSFGLPPLSASARRVPPWSEVAGKLPLLSFGSNHYTTSPATSSTHNPPPLTAGGPDGRRWRHQPCPRVPPLFRRSGCQPKLKWAGIAGFDRPAGLALWPTTAMQPARHNGPPAQYYSSIFLFLEFTL
jgi:hypothetical protein